MMFDAITQELPVVILGAGLTGRSCARYCQKRNLPFVLADTRIDTEFKKEMIESFGNENVRLGEFESTLLNNAGVVVKSPGIDSSIDIIQIALEREIPIVSDIDIFIEQQSSKIIAITGSNGKSTVCDCLVATMNSLGIKGVAAGNIGVPVLDLLEQSQPDVYVVELSSFQLESMKTLNADIAVILNVTEDHLDRHGSFEDYIKAKQNIYIGARSIVFNQDDTDTFYQLDKDVSTVSFGESIQAQLNVSMTERGFVVARNNRELIHETDTALKGIHNGFNLAACIAILELFGVAFSTSMKSALCAYQGLRHRCERVQTTDGIEWINDSKATNPGATAAAIKSLSGNLSHLYLIAGGDAKGGDIASLSETIKQNITYSWVYGKDAQAFVDHLSDTCSKVADLESAVRAAKQNAKQGDKVLLSPACASIDMYRNYQERGEHFSQLVREVIGE